MISTDRPSPAGPPCGHPPFCGCPTPAITPDRLGALAADWAAEIAASR